MRQSCFGACLLAACLAAGCSATSATPQTRTDSPPSVAAPPADDGTVHIQEASRQFIQVEAVSAGTTSSAIAAPAHVDFRDGAVSQLGAPMDGRVVSVQAQIGARVKAGEPLVTLDCPDAAETRAQVDSVRASLREARAAAERQARMLTQGVGIEKDRIAADTRVSELEADLTRVEADLAFVGSGHGTTVVLRAPIAGTVITRKATIGLAVQRGGDPIVEIGNPDALWIVADVFERDLPLVHANAHATVEFESLTTPLTGRVTSIGTVVASGLRSVPIHIALDAAATSLKPGMFGRAQVQAFSGAMTVPTEAVLIRDGKESVVYVEKTPTTFERREVAVAQHVGGRVQVLSGLAPGDRVVVHGALLLDNAAEQLL